MASIFDLFKKIETQEQASVKPICWIVAGLGNPGEEYARTRHNAGFMALDYVSQKEGFKLKNAKFNALCADAFFAGSRVLFMKPQTYMNASGEAVRDAAEFYKIPPEHIIVISDDVSFEPGCMRVRRKGSDGGQKGLKSIIYQLRTDNFPRIRLGVGKLPEGGNMANWVLGGIPESAKEGLFSCIENTYDALGMIIRGDIDGAMQKYN